MSLHESPRQNSQLGTGGISELPVPNAEAVKHSLALVDKISEKIQQSGGKIPFFDYMTMALMAPGLGYYSAGSQKFGAAGDFVTAPEESPLFSQCVASQCEQILASLASFKPDILEIGAGSGRMAAEILRTLAKQNVLPEHYFIFEPSADLQQRQRETIGKIASKHLDRVQWLQSLPERPINGIILANEILDVLPVHRFKLSQDGVKEYYVCMVDGSFRWQVSEVSDTRIIDKVQQLNIDFTAAYSSEYNSEINLQVEPWLASVASSLNNGLILLIDYGYPRQEYYHPQRHQGTLMCHYRHRAHDDPFVYPGLQDITAHVDFTLVAETAVANNLHVAGYNTQGQFLISCGIERFANEIDSNNQHAQLQFSQQVKRLTLPTGMGETFKAIALTKNYDQPLLGFSQFDLRANL